MPLGAGERDGRTRADRAEVRPGRADWAGARQARATTGGGEWKVQAAAATTAAAAAKSSALIVLARCHLMLRHSRDKFMCAAVAAGPARLGPALVSLADCRRRRPVEPVAAHSNGRQ
jgi:hypothetical protein